MAHPSIMPNGEMPWGATEQRAEHSDVFAHDVNGKLGYIRAGAPRRLATDEVSALVRTFAQAFVDARQAGFDGVELHAANGYLFEQFMNPVLNTRKDRYGGGSLRDRTRFLMEVVDAAVYELMPTGNMETAEFNARYIDHVLLAKVRATFPGAIIWCGGFKSRESAEVALETGLVDLIAFGRPYIGNPDLAERLRHGWPLVEADRSTYYTPLRTAWIHGLFELRRVSRCSSLKRSHAGFKSVAVERCTVESFRRNQLEPNDACQDQSNTQYPHRRRRVAQHQNSHDRGAGRADAGPYRVAGPHG